MQSKSSFQNISNILPSSRLSSPSFESKKRSKSWWSPVYRGLVADPDAKHRNRMGPALWLYLYLIMYANRQTGVVHRTQATIREETGYSLRSIQNHIRRLKHLGYISCAKKGRNLEFTLTKWKRFGDGGGTSNRSWVWKKGVK
jgi:hypothetical protein